MIFDNIFSSAGKGAKSGEDTGQSLSSGIPGASPTAKRVREESPEALNVLGFISALTKTFQQAASEQNAYANDPESTSKAASSVMEKSSESLKRDDDLKKSPGPGK
jgi:hypothetical protein